VVVKEVKKEMSREEADALRQKIGFYLIVEKKLKVTIVMKSTLEQLIEILKIENRKDEEKLDDMTSYETLSIKSEKGYEISLIKCEWEFGIEPREMIREDPIEYHTAMDCIEQVMNEYHFETLDRELVEYEEL
jgi:hypothetical protein